MRHYDLDGVALMGPFCRDLEAAMGPAAAKALGVPEVPPVRATAHEPATRGSQVARREERVWRFERDGSALSLEVDIHRFINPPTGAVNHTLELFAAPQSKRAGAARAALLLGTPTLGLLLGLALWRGLQWDTNMPSGPWMIVGALLGLLSCLAALPALTHRLGALLEGRRALVGAAARERLLAAAAAVVEQAAASHGRRDDRASAAVGAPPVDEPAALAAYARELAAAPDAAVERYGLTSAANRATIARCFRALEKDAARYRAFLEARDG